MAKKPERIARHFCEPEWHDGAEDIEADYLVLAKNYRDEISMGTMGIAVCRVHVEAALSGVLMRLDSVMVRKVDRT